MSLEDQSSTESERANTTEPTAQWGSLEKEISKILLEASF